MILELKNIYKTYEQGKMDVPVLKNISMNIEKGDYVAIMGPSGSGKTTLMNLIGCLDYPSSGEYLLDGDNVLLGNDSKLSDVRLNSIGFVFQSFHLLPRQTALENVALPLLYAGIKKKDRMEIARLALGRVGLSDRTDFKPTQLSGGQCQRVAIARAIVNNPKILLADEPTGALDTASGKQIMELFESLNRDGVTVIMITHEREIAQYANTIFYIRDGRLVDQDGRFLQPDPDPMNSDGYEAPTLPSQNQNMPVISAENPRKAEEPSKPESAITDSLPPKAPPETNMQENSLHHTTGPSAARSIPERTAANPAPVPAAPNKQKKYEHAAQSAVQNQNPLLVPENNMMDSHPVTVSNTPVQRRAVHPTPAKIATPVTIAEQSIPVTQSYDEFGEQERLLRMDMDALLSRMIGDARQAEPKKTAATEAAAPPLAKKATVPKPAGKRIPAMKPVPASKPAAPKQAPAPSPAPVSKPAAAKPAPAVKPTPSRKPSPASKPAPSDGVWATPRGNTVPVFAFEKNGGFNRPIKIDLNHTDMGDSPWLFSTRGK